ncbi:MAG: glycoside hydrolase family 2 [Clostridiales bacterium]|nr:glycoside hydrolase family 2 [Clostridiales bacterium]
MQKMSTVYGKINYSVEKIIWFCYNLVTMIIKPVFNENGIPLSEYPRPQFKRDSYLCLNGEWEYSITQSKDRPQEYDGKILVPYSPESDLSGVKRQLLQDQYLHYNRKFILNKSFNKGRILLNFGAVDQVCEVYVNGDKVGAHEGGYLPFTFDITKSVMEGENDLYVLVQDDANSNVYGRGKQRYKRGGIWYTATSGIWQTVWLESTAKDYIKGIKITPSVTNSTVTFNCNLEGEGEVRAEIYDGEEIVYKGVFNSDNQLIAPLSNPKLWSTDSPNLYTVKLFFNEDEVESYFGMREFSVLDIKGKKCFGLNGKPIFHNGLLDQGYFHDGIYTPKSNKVYYDEITNLKNLGFNMLRKHIKVEPWLWYYYCDISGILVWQDMINGGGQYNPLRIALCPFVNLNIDDSNYKKMKRDNPKSREFYFIEAKGLIDNLYNCVSLCLWTPFNEAWGQFDAYKVWKELSSYDGTRLYDHASGWQDKGGGDLCSKHIYFRKLKMKNDGKRILALTEFGGYSRAVEGHVFTSKKFGYKSFNDTKKLQKAYNNLYENEVIPLIKTQLLGATVYTQVTDVEDEVNGLYTYDRILKFDQDEIKRINGEVYKAFDEQTKSI